MRQQHRPKTYKTRDKIWPRLIGFGRHKKKTWWDRWGKTQDLGDRNQNYATRKKYDRQSMKNSIWVNKIYFASGCLALIYLVIVSCWLHCFGSDGTDIEYYGSKNSEYCYIVWSPSNIHTWNRIRFESLEACRSFIEQIR